MGSTTATVLVGSAHPNHGGINPTHQLFLNENSRPAWLLHAIQTAQPSAVWIPTVDDMLEDALLMIGLLVVKHSQLSAAAIGAFGGNYPTRVAMYDDIAERERRRLYELCREIDFSTKIVITALHGSTIFTQIGVLNRYQMDVEVCRSSYCRQRSAWSPQPDVFGSLS